MLLARAGCRRGRLSGRRAPRESRATVLSCEAWGIERARHCVGIHGTFAKACARERAETLSGFSRCAG
eukprot:5563657-Alexandrium_andersonii.AAC.1